MFATVKTCLCCKTLRERKKNPQKPSWELNPLSPKLYIKLFMPTQSFHNNLPLSFPQDFYFRQLRKVKVGDPVVGPEGRHSLLCTSNEFGLTFVGCGDGKLVVLTLPMMKLVSEPDPKKNDLVNG